jgi:rhodanese-related sulfurtransferase
VTTHDDLTRPSAHPTRVDAAALRGWTASDAAPRILDVRGPGEFQTMHIPGSYNVPLDTLREHRDELQRHVADDVVLVCHSGMRAQQAERALAEVGMPNLHVLDGGIVAWERSGGPVNRGRTRWDIERQVRLAAGLLVLLGVLASTVVPGMKWFAGAIGAGLAFAALTNTCAMGAALSKLPFNRQAASCDVSAVVAQLKGSDQPTAAH